MLKFRTALLAAMAGFHALLLSQRLADSTILEPAVLAKYAAAFLLLAGLWAFQRYAPPHLRDRRAQAVFWLLVLVLHAIAPSNDVAIVELALVAPLAIAVFAFRPFHAHALRALHEGLTGNASAVRVRVRVPLPARAPPRA
jgi:hypothetical protein